MKNESKPKPCPYCYNKDIEFLTIFGNMMMVENMFAYRCKSCGTHGLIKGTKESALRCWNNNMFLRFDNEV